MIANLNNILENFQTEYINIFCTITFSKLCNCIIEECNAYYRKSVENFISFEDQIKELEMMLDGNENNEANNTLKLMIDNLINEKKKIEIDLKFEFDEKVKTVMQSFSIDNTLEESSYYKNLMALIKSKFLDILSSNESAYAR